MLDVAALVATLMPVPWLASSVSAVLGGLATERRLNRIREVLQELAADISGMQAQVEKSAKEYVQTEDFEDLLEETLRRVGRERAAAKRRVYCRFLLGAIIHQARYDEEIELLRALELLQPEHLRVLAAIAKEVPNPSVTPGSRAEKIARRLGGQTLIDIGAAVERLNHLRVTDFRSLGAYMVSGDSEEDLRHTITPFGRRLVQLLTGETKP